MGVLDLLEVMFPGYFTCLLVLGCVLVYYGGLLRRGLRFGITACVWV